MKQIFILIILVTTISCKGQNPNQIRFTYENFENEILKYEPIQRENVSDKDYKNGLRILNDTKSTVKNNASLLNDADFWNLTMAFLNFKEPKSNIEISFRKAISFENNNICSYIDAFGPSSLDKIIPELFYEFYNSCKEKSSTESPIDLKSYSTKNSLNYNLVLLIDKVSSSDNLYRKEKGKYYEDSIKLNEQRKLDSKNQHVIDSLYSQHKTYIGNSLVGKKFSYVMWSVIQHSNLEMMEKYLPVLQHAVKNKELDLVPFKMLIDRYYGLKHGFQIFGSQNGFGFEMADKKKKKEIEFKYGIE